MTCKMKKVLAAFLVSSGFLGIAYAQSQKELPVSISAVSDIGGFVGDRILLNRDSYLKTFPIDRYVDFIVERQHTAWDWTKAEQHGKWLESAFLSASQSGDSELMDKMKYELSRILASQEPCGYIGATAKDYRSPERPIRGMDPYELYFFFHALITIGEQSGDTAALNGAQRLADYFIDNFGEGKNEFWPSPLRWPENRWQVVNSLSEFAGHGVHYSLEGTLLCDPMSRLYEVTGQKKYLDWSRWTVKGIDRWGGWEMLSRLDSVADGTLTVDRLQPYVHSHTLHMNLMGLLRLYRCTGEKALLRKVIGAWKDIEHRQMYITGGVSVAEHYEHGFVKPLSGNIVETCATMSWMQLTQMLLEITGDPVYADYIERIAINHVFAAQDAQTGTCRYHTAPNGTVPGGYFHGPDCCTASGHRVISLLPTFFYARNEKTFFVNQYFPATYSDDDISFVVKGNYPYDERFCVVVSQDSKHSLKLNLRIPGWCNGAQVSLNGKPLKGVKQGKYLTIHRRWKQGDTVELYFPMQLSWQHRANHSQYHTYRLSSGEIMYTETPAETAPYAFLRGPVVYAMDMVWNKGVSADNVDMAKDIRIDPTLLPVQQTMGDSQHQMSPSYTACGYVGGTPTQFTLVPFASIGQWWRDGEPMPARNQDAFSYAIWLNAKQ